MFYKLISHINWIKLFCFLFFCNITWCNENIFYSSVSVMTTENQHRINNLFPLSENNMLVITLLSHSQFSNESFDPREYLKQTSCT